MNKFEKDTKTVVEAFRLPSKAMLNREKYGGGIWKCEGHGYQSMITKNPSIARINSQMTIAGGMKTMLEHVCYIALPHGHPCIKDNADKHMDLNVNGGITFHDDNVFGWDYAHSYNENNPDKHIAEAIRYFKIMACKREKVKK